MCVGGLNVYSFATTCYPSDVVPSKRVASDVAHKAVFCGIHAWSPSPTLITVMGRVNDGCRDKSHRIQSSLDTLRAGAALNNYFFLLDLDASIISTSETDLSAFALDIARVVEDDKALMNNGNCCRGPKMVVEIQQAFVSGDRFGGTRTRLRRIQTSLAGSIPRLLHFVGNKAADVKYVTELGSSSGSAATVRQLRRSVCQGPLQAPPSPKEHVDFDDSNVVRTRPRSKSEDIRWRRITGTIIRVPQTIVSQIRGWT
ncbi:hypothetical protein FISHEDRAFT_55551 [Fistulina hepatica ATCC 64428]|uniref:Uncharacterized protein n=1 Tax=Fistulina hepatica ATCC 64428 TaxID=1128425 RepID=A0A0D7ANK6_9AGAR|nr:hypothetical protein FISHEDRAFT_55551 [Fistulina hepatica ATCC 64428]